MILETERAAVCAYARRMVGDGLVVGTSGSVSLRAGEPVTAVVHTHSPHATAVSTLVGEVPPIHYIVATIGPSVRVARYATYGTPELATAVLEALDGRRGCLMANHG